MIKPAKETENTEKIAVKIYEYQKYLNIIISKCIIILEKAHSECTLGAVHAFEREWKRGNPYGEL